MDVDDLAASLANLQLLLLLLVIVIALLALTLVAVLTVAARFWFVRGRGKQAWDQEQGIGKVQQGVQGAWGQEEVTSRPWSQEGVGQAGPYHQLVISRQMDSRLPDLPNDNSNNSPVYAQGSSSSVCQLEGRGVNSRELQVVGRQVCVDKLATGQQTEHEETENIYAEIGEGRVKTNSSCYDSTQDGQILDSSNQDVQINSSTKDGQVNSCSEHTIDVVDGTCEEGKDKKGKDKSDNVSSVNSKVSSVVYGLITAKEVAKFVPCTQTVIVRNS